LRNGRDCSVEEGRRDRASECDSRNGLKGGRQKGEGGGNSAHRKNNNHVWRKKGEENDVRGDVSWTEPKGCGKSAERENENDHTKKDVRGHE